MVIHRRSANQIKPGDVFWPVLILDVGMGVLAFFTFVIIGAFEPEIAPVSAPAVATEFK